MLQHKISVVIAFIALVSALPNAASAQQKTLRERAIGAWSYVSSTAKAPDGSPFWGQNPKGLFILTEDGHFSWQVFRSDRPKFASNNRLNATADELKANNQGSLAYFGTYSVDEVSKTITFTTEASTYPNNEGEVLKRIITKLTPDEFVYANPANTLGQAVEATWKRLN